ncbi:MAG TPA: hypothetical protein VML94_00095 [Thermoplasmata archaeon]|nr:hypothetical protein [Thermoplasmata archaeon]
MQTTQNLGQAAAPVPGPTPGRIFGFAPSIPKDGGTMLAAATVLGFLSFLFDLQKYHIGSSPIPAWVPIAIDAAIAGAVGAVLVVGSRWFDDPAAGPSADYVVVSKPVWESVQHEIVAARAGRKAASPATSPGPVPIASRPEPSGSPRAPEPWDEGPLTPTAAAPSLAPGAAASRSVASPHRSSSPVPGRQAIRPPVSAPIPPAERPAPPARSLEPAPPAVPDAPVSPPGAPTSPPALSTAETDEIVRLGGIMGLPRRPNEPPAQYAQRIASEVDAAGREAKSPVPASAPKPPAAASVAPQSATPDIDELMSWLEKMAAEKDGAAAGTAPKKSPPSSSGSGGSDPNSR